MVKEALADFCGVFGQAVSKEKSLMYVSKGVTPREARTLSNIAGFTLAEDLGKYLGVPILHNRVLKNTYKQVVDKVLSRLNT